MHIEVGLNPNQLQKIALAFSITQRDLDYVEAKSARSLIRLPEDYKLMKEK